MKKNGGTGFGGPAGKQAIDAYEDAKPKMMKGGNGDNFPPAGAGDGGVGPKLASGGNRDSDIRSSK